MKSADVALGVRCNGFKKGSQARLSEGQDCLASEVRLNVDVDVALTVLAHGGYRWLATRLHGFDKAKPKQLYRKFVETGGQLYVHTDRLVVRFDKRAHNPILREAALDKGCLPIPWLRNLPVVFEYP